MSDTTKYFQTMAPESSSSTTPQAPQSSALPPANNETQPSPRSIDDNEHNTSRKASPNSSKVVPIRKPILRLEIRDLSSDGARAFLRLIHASAALQDAVDTVLNLLYKHYSTTCIPPTRSVTLVLREMDGVAYTTGLDLDDDHKEIHLNTKYIEAVPETRQKGELLGVLVHEMVHCWQHSGFGTAPVGLTEGVADWVRLKAGYAPPHWKRHTDCEWDAGYERTGYFLEWLEEEYGCDIVRRINEAMRGCEYDTKKVWHGCCGKSVEKLWGQYKKCTEESEGSSTTTNEIQQDAKDKSEEKDIGTMSREELVTNIKALQVNLERVLGSIGDA